MHPDFQVNPLTGRDGPEDIEYRLGSEWVVGADIHGPACHNAQISAARATRGIRPNNIQVFGPGQGGDRCGRDIHPHMLPVVLSRAGRPGRIDYISHLGYIAAGCGKTFGAICPGVGVIIRSCYRPRPVCIGV